MTQKKLGFNDRISFNKTMTRNFSGKEFDTRQIKRIFQKPFLERLHEKITRRIEFQTNLGKGEKIKNTENFDSSDEEERMPETIIELKKKALRGKSSFEDEEEQEVKKSQLQPMLRKVTLAVKFSKNAKPEKLKPSIELTEDFKKQVVL